MDKMNDAIEKIDPNAEALIEKMKAARHAKADGGGSAISRLTVSVSIGRLFLTGSPPDFFCGPLGVRW